MSREDLEVCSGLNKSMGLKGHFGRELDADRGCNSDLEQGMTSISSYVKKLGEKGNFRRD